MKKNKQQKKDIFERRNEIIQQIEEYIINPENNIREYRDLVLFGMIAMNKVKDEEFNEVWEINGGGDKFKPLIETLHKLMKVSNEFRESHNRAQHTRLEGHLKETVDELHLCKKRYRILQMQYLENSAKFTKRKKTKLDKIIQQNDRIIQISHSLECKYLIQNGDFNHEKKQT